MTERGPEPLTARWIGPCRHFSTFAVGVPHRRKALDFADRIDHFREVCVEMDVFIAHASEDKDAVARPLPPSCAGKGSAFGTTSTRCEWVTA
jgi:hypothetical protein